MIPTSPLGPRPALAAAVLLLLLAAALVGPAAAAAIISDELSEWIETGGSSNPTYYATSSPGTASVNGIEIEDIGLASYICYIVVDTTASVSIDEGTHTYNYGFSSGTYPYSGSYDVTKIRNLAGQITATRITFWFPEWRTEGRQGKQTIYFDHPLWTESKYALTPSGTAQFRLWDGTPYGSLAEPKYINSGYRITYLTGILWQNDVTVNPIVSGGNTAGYTIHVTRLHNDHYSKSTLKAYNAAGSISYDDTSTVDTVTNLLASEISRFQIISPAKTYNYTLAAPPPTSAFSLSLSPQTAPIGEPVTATLTAAAGAPAYDEVAWVHGDEQRTFMHNTSGWWEFSYSTYEYDIPSTEQAAHNYQFATDSPPGLDPPQDQVRCLVYSGGQLLQELIGRVPLTENVAKTQLAVVVIDYSGGDTPILSGATVTVKDEISKVSIPAASVDSTFSRFNVERGRRYIISASAPGFVTGTRTVSAAGEIQTVEMYLSRDAAISLPDNSTQVDFFIKDPKNKPLEDVQITLTDQTTGQASAGLTNQYGTRTFVVDKRHLYHFTISKSGYQGTGGTLDPASVGTRVFVLYPDGTGPGGAPPVTVTPDRRSNEEKAQSAIDMLASSVEGITALGLLATFMGLMYLMQPGGGRRRRRR